MLFRSSPGVRPVAIEARAEAVVDGTTVVIGPPAIADSVGARWARSRSCSHPSPSITSSSTWRAPRTSAGTHSGRGTEDGARSAGTMPRTFAPE